MTLGSAAKRWRFHALFCNENTVSWAQRSVEAGLRDHAAGLAVVIGWRRTCQSQPWHPVSTRPGAKRLPFHVVICIDVLSLASLGVPKSQSGCTGAAGHQGDDRSVRGRSAGDGRRAGQAKDTEDQVRAVADVLASRPVPLSVDDVAARSTEKHWKKRLPRILEMQVVLAGAGRRQPLRWDVGKIMQCIHTLPTIREGYRG